MSAKRLNKAHPDYKEYKRLVDEVAEERMTKYREIYEKHINTDSPDKYNHIESEMTPIERACFKKIKEIRKRFDHLYTEVPDD